MSQNESSGWEGWKSVILLIVLLNLPMLNPFQGMAEQIVNTQQQGIQIAKTISGDVQKVAEVGTKVSKDYFGGLSQEKRDEILAQILWETNENYTPMGDPRAKKGGKLKLAGSNFPPTLRTSGKNSNDANIAMYEGMVYETLLGVNYYNPFYMYPGLADKWSVSEDKMSFYFHLDPDARWADGQPVRAQDVVATWDLYTDKGIQDPFKNTFWKKWERPVALSNDVVMVRVQEKSWRNFITFAGSFYVLPSHELEKIDGKTYLDNYNKKMLTGSGPYQLKEVDQPNKIAFSRRSDYWALEKKQSIGLYNFDDVEFWFVSDENLVFEKFKKGDFDLYPIYVSREWVKELSFDKVQKGWIQKRKVFNLKPKGTQGFSFNLEIEPFNDVNIRKAFAYLWPRGMLMEKMMFNEYIYTDSFYEDSPFMGDNVPKIRFDPQKARECLELSGWVNKNSEGWLEKDGKTLEVTLNYVGKGIEKFFTTYQEELKKAGIKLNLKEVTWATKIKEVGERSFTLTYGNYGGLTFPNPEAAFHSKYADQKNSGNRWGYRNTEVDKLCEEYEASFDAEYRVKLLKKIDDIVCGEYINAFAWYAPAERLAFWNKFDMPAHSLGQVGDYRAVVSYWWYDEDKDKALRAAIKADSHLPIDPVDVYYGKER